MTEPGQDDIREDPATEVDSSSGRNVVAEARKLAAAATEEPWICTPDFVDFDGDIDRYVAMGNTDTGNLHRPDAEFIAAARSLVPALCDEVDRLRDDRDHFAEQCSDLVEAIKEDAKDLDAAQAVISRVRELHKRVEVSTSGGSLNRWPGTAVAYTGQMQATCAYCSRRTSADTSRCRGRALLPLLLTTLVRNHQTIPR